MVFCCPRRDLIFLEVHIDNAVNLVEQATKYRVRLFWKLNVKVNCIYVSKTPRAHWYFIELWFDRLLILASGDTAPVEKVSNSHWIKLSKALKPAVRDWLALAAALQMEWGRYALLPADLWKQLCVLNTGITWYFKSLYAHPSKMGLEDCWEFHYFMTKSIPRFMPFGQRNLNLIEKMDLMRIGFSFLFFFKCRCPCLKTHNSVAHETKRSRVEYTHRRG